jgi:hypothetical protein
MCLIASFSGCVNGEADPLPPAPDRALFEQMAYPVLLRDCGFPACHASSERFFQVFGPGRVRMDLQVDIFDPATPIEMQHSYERARSMLLSAPNTEASLLLRKPLEMEAGGAGHQGRDSLGRDVYPSRADAGYQALLSWAMSSSVRQ